MNTDLIFAAIATLLVSAAVVLTFKFVPGRREVFIVEVLKATFGSPSPAKRHFAGARLNARVDRPARERDFGLPRGRNRSTVREIA